MSGREMKNSVFTRQENFSLVQIESIWDNNFSMVQMVKFYFNPLPDDKF